MALWGGAGSTSNTMLPGPRPTYLPSGILIHPAVWPQQTWAENCGGRGLCAPFLGGGAGSPFNTMWPGPRPTSLPGGIFIYPTVWPQYTNVAGRQDRTDRQTDISFGSLYDAVLKRYLLTYLLTECMESSFANTLDSRMLP